MRGNAHISDVDMVPKPTDTHQDVVWFDVSMDYTFRMDVAEPVNELVGNHQHCLKRKFAPAKFEEVFQAWAKEIEDHNFVAAFIAVPVDMWNASPAGKSLVDIDFTVKPRKIRGLIFELDCNFFTRVVIQSFGILSQSHESAYVLICLTNIPR